MIWAAHAGPWSCQSPEDSGPAGAGSDHNPVICGLHNDPSDPQPPASSTPSPVPPPRSGIDRYEYVGAPNVGGWGGLCRCPSGEVFEVGDNYDACMSLACEGGEVVQSCGEGVISKQKAGWKVTCDSAPQGTSVWRQHPGTNCYRSHGAEGIAGKDPLQGRISIADCKSQCLSDPACQGIVMPSEQDPSQCWLRQNVQLSKCISPNSGY